MTQSGRDRDRTNLGARNVMDAASLADAASAVVHAARLVPGREEATRWREVANALLEESETRLGFSVGSPSPESEFRARVEAAREALLGGDAAVLSYLRSQKHDDGTGHCRVCGAAIDFERWLDEHPV